MAREAIFDSKFLAIVLCVLGVSGLAGAQAGSRTLGVFENHADVGSTLHSGSAQYDVAHHAYTLTGSDENMWFASDAFQFAWKQVSGDIA